MMHLNVGAIALTLAVALSPTALSAPMRPPAMTEHRGPRVENVQLETVPLTHESKLTEEESFEMVISAQVHPAPGGSPLTVQSVRILMHGLPVTGGRRSLDPKTGRFTLTLSADEYAHIIDSMGESLHDESPSSPPAIEVVVTDAAGQEARAPYVPPQVKSESFSFKVRRAVTDPYGRRIDVPDLGPFKPVTRPTGKPIALAGPPLSARSPLRLQRLAHHMAPELEGGGREAIRLVALAQNQVGLFSFGNDRSTLAIVDPATGNVRSSKSLVAPPKASVWQIRERSNQLYQLAWRSGPRFVVEARGTDQRTILPYQPRMDSNDYVSDFAIVPDGIVFATPDYGWNLLWGCGWDGQLRWKKSDENLLPGTQLRRDRRGFSLHQTPDSVLVFLTGQDDAQNDEPHVAGIAELNSRGDVSAARLFVSRKKDEEILGGTAVRFQGRRLMVVNVLRTNGNAHSTETRIYDMDADSAAPLMVIPSAKEEDTEVVGAVAVGDRLIVGCGWNGYELLSTRP